MNACRAQLRRRLTRVRCALHAVIALSHPLATPPGAARGAVVEWERSFAPALATPPLPFAYVLRPAFGRGRELVVYSDATHLHSAPDAINREAVWRFM